MAAQRAVIGAFTIGCMLASAILLSSGGYAQDAKVKTAMQMLMSKAEALGPPKIEGTDTVGGKEVPAIYFGSSKQDNGTALVDEVVKGAGGTATIFVKSGDEFVRVATNVKNDDGSRAIGTVLDPKGKAVAALKKGEAFYGDADVLGKPFTTGYEPIHDAAKKVIGAYYVGYQRDSSATGSSSGTGAEGGQQ